LVRTENSNGSGKGDREKSKKIIIERESEIQNQQYNNIKKQESKFPTCDISSCFIKFKLTKKEQQSFFLGVR
jgi:hypothetical protein